MFKPDSKTTFYFLIFAIISTTLSWLFYIFYKPLLIEAACGDMAAKVMESSSLKRQELSNDLSFDDVKYDCMYKSTEINQ